MKRTILLVLGWISFVVGMSGVVIPLLPTTPFLLLSASIFASNSKKCEEWLLSTKIYKRYVLAYKSQGGLTRKKKIEILFIVYTVMFVSGLFISHFHVRMVLLTIALIKLIVMIRIPTIQETEVAR